MLKLTLAKSQVSNVIELIKDNEFEQHMSTKLWSVYYELERQQKNLHMLTRVNNHPDIVARIIGSIMVILAYFTILHINVTIGVTINLIADLISIPYFVRTKSFDVVVMLAFLISISVSKLIS